MHVCNLNTSRSKRRKALQFTKKQYPLKNKIGRERKTSPPSENRFSLRINFAAGDGIQIRPRSSLPIDAPSANSSHGMLCSLGARAAPMESPSRPPRSPKTPPAHFRAPGTEIYSASGRCRKKSPLATTGRAIWFALKVMGVEAKHPLSHSVTQQAKQEEAIDALAINKQLGGKVESSTSPYKIGHSIFPAGRGVFCICGRMGGRTKVTVPDKYVWAVSDNISHRYVDSAPPRL